MVLEIKKKTVIVSYLNTSNFQNGFTLNMNNFENGAENWKPNHLVFNRQIIVCPLMCRENYDILKFV